MNRNEGGGGEMKRDVSARQSKGCAELQVSPPFCPQCNTFTDCFPPPAATALLWPSHPAPFTLMPHHERREGVDPALVSAACTPDTDTYTCLSAPRPSRTSPCGVEPVSSSRR